MEATKILFVLVVGLIMITSSVFVSTTGLPVLAKKLKSSDSGSSDGGSGSGSSGGSSDSGSDKGSDSDTGTSTGMGMNEKTGEMDNPPKVDNPSTNPVKPSEPKFCGGEGFTDPNCNPRHVPGSDCAFHPDSDKCKPDNVGNCPPGFAHNVHGNCFPEGKCPPGFGRRDNDESGKCFRNGLHCPPGFHGVHGICTKNIVINIHKHTTTTVSHNLNNQCFNEIKIAWLGKIHRGQNQAVDNIIDKCLGVR